MKPRRETREVSVALLTGGSDRPYVYGLATALMSKGVPFDLIGSDELDFPELRGVPGVKFLNLRGDMRPDVSARKKVLRIMKYYARLLWYAVKARPKVFHILWNNRFETFDRTLLMLYYRLLGKKIAFTAHNVNAGKRDLNDTCLNRLTLRIQYRLAHHIFVHNEQMKRGLREDFGVEESRVTVIPLGINNAVPNSGLTSREARQRLGLREGEKAILFFGRIKPYKGLENLIGAHRWLLAARPECRLIIAGMPLGCEDYWHVIQEGIWEDVAQGRILLKEEFIPDEETEVYFKAADVFVLPYKDIFQSGVLSLGYSFGLPVVASDVGSMKDEIVEDRTGFICRAEDPVDLAMALERYFSSDLYANLKSHRPEIQSYAAQRYSWDAISQVTLSVYASVLTARYPEKTLNSSAQSVSIDVKLNS